MPTAGSPTPQSSRLGILSRHVDSEPPCNLCRLGSRARNHGGADDLSINRFRVLRFLGLVTGALARGCLVRENARRLDGGLTEMEFCYYQRLVLSLACQS